MCSQCNPPQVAFYSPVGEKLSFVAMPSKSHAALCVREPDGTAIGDFSTDADGHCFFYAAAPPPDASTSIGGGSARVCGVWEVWGLFVCQHEQWRRRLNKETASTR